MALLLAVFFEHLRCVGAVEEFSFEQLDADDSEDELKQRVDDQDIDNVLERVEHAVKYSLKQT